MLAAGGEAIAQHALADYKRNTRSGAGI